MTQICIGFDLRIKSGAILTARQKLLQDQFLVDRIYHKSGDPSVWLRPVNVDSMLNDHAEVRKNPLGLIRNMPSLMSIDLLNPGHSTNVAITSHQALASPLEKRFGPGWIDLDVTVGLLQSAGWSFIGFDILDLRGLISGLNGCSYSSESKNSLRKEFENCCNQVGLFESFSIATAFANVRSFQLRSHAPFVTVGIYVKCADK